MLKIKFILFFGFFLVFPCIAYSGTLNEKQDLPKNILKKKYDTIIVIQKMPNEILIAQQTHQANNSYEKNMPWIAAIFIGLLAFCANIFISYNSRKTSLEVTSKQLDKTTEITLAQIDTAKRNSERDFNKTVLSGNRQLWITEFRVLMSEIISTLHSFIVKGEITDQDYSSFRIIIIKSKLMLNPSDDVVLFEMLTKAQNVTFEIVKKNCEVDTLEEILQDITNQTFKKLTITWDKVTKGE